jgi:lysozyme
MKTSPNGLAALMVREGSRSTAYKDTKGIWTIGVGHTGPEVCEGLIWSDQQILAQLAIDIGKAEACINSVVKVPLETNQFDALASFIFNVGVNAFSNSTMLKKINVSDFTGAIKEFDKWHIPPEITGRRNSERTQFAGS